MLQTSVPSSETAKLLSYLTEAEKDRLLFLLRLQDKERRERLIETFYRKTGPLRRELYQKHLQFFRAGISCTERAAIAANRVGKTWGIGAYEVACHLTGLYPDWWEGRTFEDEPIRCWVAGDTFETTRDVPQLALTGIGEGGEGTLGTGMIPGRFIEGTSAKGAPVGAFDTVGVRHSSGGISTLGFKAYDQRRQKFQGTEKHVIWMDEEPPADVYDEAMLRLMTVNGLMICTFTPMLGLSEIALRYMPHLEPKVDDA